MLQMIIHWSFLDMKESNGKSTTLSGECVNILRHHTYNNHKIFFLD